MNECNLCEFKGIFSDHANRKYVRCPICKSFERQRFIWDYITYSTRN